MKALILAAGIGSRMGVLTDNLPKILAHFGIQGTIGEIFEGPLITDVQFKLSEGSKFSYLEKLIKDIVAEKVFVNVRKRRCSCYKC